MREPAVDGTFLFKIYILLEIRGLLFRRQILFKLESFFIKGFLNID